MAVLNYFDDNATNVGTKTEPGSNAHEVIRYIGKIVVASGDTDASTYLVAKAVPASFRPVQCTIMTDAITSGTDYDLGFYDSVTGTVVDKDILMDGQTMASASRTLDGLSNVAIEDIGARKTIYELLGLTATTTKATYDLVLTANTVGSADGDIVVIFTGFAA